MNIKGLPVLCGGTFLTLLLEAAKQGLNERKKFGESSEFTESDVLEALFQVAIPTYERPTDDENFKSVVSAYKSCNTSKSGRLPIHGQANITTFTNRIKNDYQAPLSAMTVLIEKYIDFDGKGDWLIRAVLELIEIDKTILDDDVFCISSDNSPTTKTAIRSLTDICTTSFLLGVWHFIVVNRKDNGLGKATYDEWCKPGKSKNTREPFKSSIGDVRKRKIAILPFAGITVDTIKNEPDDIGDEQTIEQDEPYTDQSTADTDAKTTNQTINNPVVFNQYGNNNIQIGSIGTLTINND